MGFTLVELLITIFLISVGLIGVISFFNSSLQSQFDAKNEVIAAGLAQEATELVRNIVDNNFLNDSDWYQSLYDDITNTSSCKAIDRRSIVFDPTYPQYYHKCITANYPFVCFNAGSSTYYQCNLNPNDPEKTIFFRSLAISGHDMDSPLNGVDLSAEGDCLDVVATVGWPNTDAACANDISACPYKTASTDIICKPRQ